MILGIFYPENAFIKGIPGYQGRLSEREAEHRVFEITLYPLYLHFHPGHLLGPLGECLTVASVLKIKQNPTGRGGVVKGKLPLPSPT
jgi:hypothetical protein